MMDDDDDESLNACRPEAADTVLVPLAILTDIFQSKVRRLSTKCERDATCINVNLARAWAVFSNVDHKHLKRPVI